MGRATAPRLVNVRSAAAGPQIKPHARSFGTLGRNGKAAGSTLPARRSTGVKPQPASAPAVAGSPNSGQAPRILRSPFARVLLNKPGITQGKSNCGSCQPPDPNAAVSPTQIAHVVNLRLQVYKKGGAAACPGVGLNTLLGTTASLSDPHIQWDNVNKRFSMVVIPVPASNTATPTEFVLATTTASACGTWFVYTVTFSGGLFPAGTLLDYPYLGQDNNPSGSFPFGGSILSSTNNFCCSSNGFGSYLGSTAFAIPKYPVYNGQGFSFAAFSVSFSTAPVTVSGLGKAKAANTYWLASVPGSGYNLYVMTHSSQPGTTLALQASISSPFNAPSRRVNQPGTSQTLDPLDGRIDSPPEIGGGGFLWFTHGIDLGGFPAIRYGAISVSSNTATAANAFHSASSDDFNPSLAVTPTSGSGVFIWLNWAYTDTPSGIATSDTTNGVVPGGGVPTLNGSDLTLVNGFPTSSNFRFGDLSSVEVDPSAVSTTCPKGRAAVMTNEYFNSAGLWVTRIARVSFC
jgi:hypothetical protein